MRKPPTRTKILCDICQCLVSRSNITKHKLKCSGKPSWAVRKTNNLPIGEWCNRKNKPVNEQNWQEIQAYYDNDHSYADVMKRYRFNTTYLSKAIKLGLFKTRSRTETARVRDSYIREQSQERKENTSKAMRRAVLEGRQKTPKPYGRYLKRYTVLNSSGEEEVLHGGWEKIVADYCNAKGIAWLKPKKSFTYVWESKQHEYFPDFYLSNFNVYIEVKGMETERDRCKWECFPDKLLIINKNNINDLEAFFNNIVCK
jgi:hypothetical protein